MKTFTLPFLRPRKEVSVAEQQQRRAFAALSVAHPSDPLGWIDSPVDGATCAEPKPTKQSAAQRRAAEAKQREIVEQLRKARCAKS